MIENAMEIFSGHLFTTLTGTVKGGRQLPVKKHTENLQTLGDFSFPSSFKAWSDNMDDNKPHDYATILQCVHKLFGPNYLLEESISWNLRVKTVREGADRLILYLERPLAISVGFHEALRNNVLIKQRLQKKNISVRTNPTCEQSNCLTTLRVHYVSKVIENLCAICEKSPGVLVTASSCYKNKEETVVLICAPVLNAKTGSKENQITSEDFIRMRQDQMTLIAQHKYGVRVNTDSKWKEFLEHLGESAAAFELLQGRPSSTVKINFDNVAAGASKGASFILYNCARLETIIRTYDDKVKEGKYPPLPDIEHIDFSLLNLEDEWSLIFNYILGFPSMLEQCVKIDDEHCEFRPHYICSFLSSMVRVCSQYYRRTRILVHEDGVPSSCVSCLTGKMHESSFPRAATRRAANPLELIHSDVCGPMQVSSWGGARYLLTFTDDKTRKTFGFLMKNKSEEPRKHLLPVIYSRMHMLMILNDILKTCLKILNIKSVSQM